MGIDFYVIKAEPSYTCDFLFADPDQSIVYFQGAIQITAHNRFKVDHTNVVKISREGKKGNIFNLNYSFQYRKNGKKSLNFEDGLLEMTLLQELEEIPEVKGMIGTATLTPDIKNIDFQQIGELLVHKGKLLSR